jgi:predicted aspartyl protease
MKRLLAHLLATIPLTFVCLPAAPARAEDPQALLARAKEAAGGGAWDRVQTLHLKVRLTASGLSGTVESWEDVLTGRFLDTFALGPVTGAEGFDGTVDWEIDPSGTVTANDSGDGQEGSADEAYRRSLAFWYAGRHKAAITDAGTETEGGHSFRVLRIVPEGGRPFDLWLDAVTLLADRTVERRSNEVRTTRFSDYRTVEGLKLPFSSVTTNGEPKYDQIQITESVEVNPVSPESLTARFARPVRRADDFAIAGGKTSSVLPFRLINNHLYIQASVEGRPVQFLLDSGGLNALTPAAVARLGLKAEGSLQLHGVGGSEDVSLTHVKEVRTGDVSLREQTFFVLPLKGVAEAEGMEVDGMLGFELFKRLVVRVDYAAQTLTFTRPEAFKDPAGGTVVPFTFDDRTPQVEGKLDGVPGKFGIDTGSRTFLTISRPFAEEHGLRAHYGAKLEAMSGWGVGGGVRSVLARAGVLELGALKVTAPVVDIVVSEKGSFNNLYQAGNVGGGLLKRFTVTFDYPRQRLIFEPTANSGLADVWDRSGLWINHGPGSNAFAVMDVVAGGPGAEAGLHAGDVILSFDGKSGQDLDLADVRRLLLGAPGTRIRLRVRGQEGERDATLILRDLV